MASLQTPGTTGGSITVTSTSRNPAQAARTVNAHVDAYLAYLRQQAQHQYDVLNQTLQPQIASLQQQIAALDQQIALAAAGVGPPNPVAATQRNALSAQLAPLQTQLQNSSIGVALAGQDVQVVSRATPPTQRTSPDPKTDLLVALGAGLLLGVAVAFLLEFLDDSIRSRQDLLAAAGNSVPVMGVIPAGRSSRADVVSIIGAPVPAAEAYRSLRTAVNFAQLKGSNCIEITSTRSRQGKTETLANLAVLAARARASGSSSSTATCGSRASTTTSACPTRWGSRRSCTASCSPPRSSGCPASSGSTCSRRVPSRPTPPSCWPPSAATRCSPRSRPTTPW